MKSCDNCRYLSGNECDLWGDYVPSPFDTGEGCKLKHNEVEKLIRLADNVRFDHGTKEDMAKYDDYFTQLKHKYEVE